MDANEEEIKVDKKIDENEHEKKDEKKDGKEDGKVDGKGETQNEIQAGSSIARLVIKVLLEGQKAKSKSITAPKNPFSDWKDESPKMEHEKPGKARDQLGEYEALKIKLLESVERYAVALNQSYKLFCSD